MLSSPPRVFQNTVTTLSHHRLDDYCQFSTAAVTNYHKQTSLYLNTDLLSYSSVVYKPGFALLCSLPCDSEAKIRVLADPDSYLEPLVKIQFLVHVESKSSLPQWTLHELLSPPQVACSPHHTGSSFIPPAPVCPVLLMLRIHLTFLAICSVSSWENFSVKDSYNYSSRYR